MTEHLEAAVQRMVIIKPTGKQGAAKAKQATGSLRRMMDIEQQS